MRSVDASAHRGHAFARRMAPVALILTVVALATVLVDPRGDMPLNDDWNFALAAWHFEATGEMMLARLTGMSLKLQVLWGALWTALFGRSFEVLRASTLLLAVLTTLLVFTIARAAGVTQKVALVAALAFFFHPLYFWSAFTFMTHVPYVFVSLAAFGAIWRGLSRDHLGWFSAGVAGVLAACFIRQTGFVALFPPLVLLMFHREAVTRRWDRYCGVIVAALAVFAIIYTTTDWLHGYPGTIALHTDIWSNRFDDVLGRMFGLPIMWSALTFQYGFFCLMPLALLTIPEVRRTLRSRKWLLSFLVIFGFFAWAVNDVARFRSYFPYGNVLLNFGFGPMTTRDGFQWRYPYPRHLAEPLLLVLTIFVTIGAAALVTWLVKAALSHREDAGANALLWKLGVLQCFAGTAILWTSGIYFDRYVLDALWPLSILFALAMGDSSRKLWTAAALTAVVAVIGIFGMHEYLDWNRARWSAYRDLRARGVTLQEMDAGYEINQYLLGSFDGPLRLRRKGMSVVDDEYILTLNEVSGYQTIAAHSYSSVFGLGKRDLYTQHRREGHPDGIR